MSYIRRGSCNRCGECCRTEVAERLKDETGYCRYATSNDGKIFACRLARGEFSGARGIARPPDVPIEDFEYFLRECIPYPIAETTIEKNHPLPERCGFYFEEVR